MIVRAMTGGLLLTAAIFVGSGTRAQPAEEGLTIGRATAVAPGAARVFDLYLNAGQGVIIDLTAIAASAEPAIVSAAAAATASLRIAGPDGSCLRAIPARNGCPATSLAAEIEAAAGSGTARAAVRAEAGGRYRIGLSLPQDPAIARYELLVRERPLPPPARAIPVALCTSPLAQNPASDPCAQPFMLDASGRAYFTFATREPDRGVQIDMRSTAFDSVVELLGPLAPGSPVELAPPIDSNDDGAGEFDARINRVLPQPGEYVVLARSYSGGTGEYWVAVRAFEPPPARPAQPLVLGETIESAFTEGAIEPFHAYALTGRSGQSLVVDVLSPLDLTLEAGLAASVFNAVDQAERGFASVAYNDDTCGLNPQLKLRFEGDQDIVVRVAVTGSTGAAGAYSIAVKEDDGIACAE